MSDDYFWAMSTALQQMIEAAWDDRSLLETPDVRSAVEKVVEKLDNGSLRVATPGERGDWIVNDWVKKGILLYFPLHQSERPRLKFVHSSSSRGHQ